MPTICRPWPSEGLALRSMVELVNMQAGELRCTRSAAEAGMPVDEVCATAVDRIQDEIDRRADSPQYGALGCLGYPAKTLDASALHPWRNPTP
jgi:hypothetical protein